VVARTEARESRCSEVDRSTIRYLLTLTPEQRVVLAAAEARNLRLFDLEVGKSKGR
jgi:hypothetical protein